MISSVEKTIHYLDAVSKDHHLLKFADVEYNITPKETFRIRPSMFCRDYCLFCGQCCRNYDTVFFPTDYVELKRRADAGEEPFQFYVANCKEYAIDIDGREFNYISVAPMNYKDKHDIWVEGHTTLNCRWIFLQGDKKLCKIHEYRAITCGFPHMELYMNRVRTHGFLGHKQFGRNDHLGCKVDIRLDIVDQATLDSNMYWLKRLKEIADYFEFRTYLPEIISHLEKVKLSNLPTSDIILTSRQSRKRLFKNL